VYIFVIHRGIGAYTQVDEIILMTVGVQIGENALQYIEVGEISR